VIAVIVSSSVALASVASAQEPVETPPATSAIEVTAPMRSNAVVLNMGLGSAIGELGLTYLRVVAPHVEVEAGLGLGETGSQFSLMPKAFFGSEHDRFVIGAGVSATAGASSGLPVWLNVDVAGFEHRAQDGFVLMMAAGFAKGLGGGTVQPTDCLRSLGCNGIASVPVQRDTFPQFRVGLGYAF
jgi:hypothetical protein